MKYGLFCSMHAAPFVNYGDYAQTIAIYQLYIQMGIPENEIVYLSYSDLSEYDGEPLILPFNFQRALITDCKSVSPHIIPVFLGISLSDLKILNRMSIDEFRETGWVDYLINHAPVGTRDEFSRKMLQKLGVPSYLQGCLTNILPCRNEGDYKKVFFIHCPDEVLPHIPPELLVEAEVLSNSGDISGLSLREIYDKIDVQYQYLRDNAKLIVTSRYHIAVPCNAMGIPTVFVRKPVDINIEDVRLDTLNPHIPLYSLQDFDKINWNYTPDDFPDIKKAIADCAVARIREVASRIEMQQIVRPFFKDRIDDYERVISSEINYFEALTRYITKNFPNPISCGYYIYGAKKTNDSGGKFPIIEHINRINPNLVCKVFIDKHRRGEMLGYPIYEPHKVNISESDFVVVIAETAIEDAMALFAKNGISQYLILTTQLITQKMLEARRNEIINT